MYFFVLTFFKAEQSQGKGIVQNRRHSLRDDGDRGKTKIIII